MIKALKDNCAWPVSPPTARLSSASTSEKYLIKHLGNGMNLLSPTMGK